MTLKDTLPANTAGWMTSAVEGPSSCDVDGVAGSWYISGVILWDVDGVGSWDVGKIDSFDGSLVPSSSPGILRASWDVPKSTSEKKKQ